MVYSQLLVQSAGKKDEDGVPTSCFVVTLEKHNDGDRTSNPVSKFSVTFHPSRFISRKYGPMPYPAPYGNTIRFVLPRMVSASVSNLTRVAAVSSTPSDSGTEKSETNRQNRAAGVRNSLTVGLLTTCRIINLETMPMVLGERLVFHSANALCLFMSLISIEEANCLRHLEIRGRGGVIGNGPTDMVMPHIVKCMHALVQRGVTMTLSSLTLGVSMNLPSIPTLMLLPGSDNGSAESIRLRAMYIIKQRIRLSPHVAKMIADACRPWLVAFIHDQEKTQKAELSNPDVQVRTAVRNVMDVLKVSYIKSIADCEYISKEEKAEAIHTFKRLVLERLSVVPTERMLLSGTSPVVFDGP
jgi:hypothetical protein